MDNWILLFIFLLLCINFTTSLIIKCLLEKPLGRQSIFDSSVRDTLMIMRWYGSLASVMCIMGRSEDLRNLFLEYSVVLAAASLLFTFSLVLLCVHVGCLCIIRILCIAKLSFMEDTIGELRIRDQYY